MVRLSDLKTDIRTVGTAGYTSETIADGMVRRIYKVRVQQRGATLSNFYLYGKRGATLGATIDQFKFDVANQIIEFPDGMIQENSAPIYQIDRATYDAFFVSVEAASVDIFMIFADEYP